MWRVCQFHQPGVVTSTGWYHPVETTLSVALPRSGVKHPAPDLPVGVAEQACARWLPARAPLHQLDASLRMRYLWGPMNAFDQTRTQGDVPTKGGRPPPL